MSELISIPFVPGTGLNFDDDPRFQQPGDGMRENVVPIDDGKQGLLRTIKGHIEKTSPTIQGTDKDVVGATYDVKTRGIIYFLKSRTEGTIYDSIIRYNIETDDFDTIVHENTVLNFGDRVSARVLDKYLIFTTPKIFAIDIEEARKFTVNPATSVYSALDEESMSFIRYAPSERPDATYDSDSGYEHNFLKGKQFQFCYKYEYYDHSQSVWSPVSAVPVGDPDEDIYGNFITGWINNIIEVEIPEGSDLVKKIHIAARDGNTSLFREVEIIDKDDASWVASDNYYTYEFKNDVRGTIVPDEEIFRMYDDVPLTADHTEIIDKNVITFAEITKGFDPITLDVSLTPTLTDVDVIPASEGEIQSVFFLGAEPEDNYIDLRFPDIDYEDLTVTIYWKYGSVISSMSHTFDEDDEYEDVIDHFIAQLTFPDDFSKETDGAIEVLRWRPEIEDNIVEEGDAFGIITQPSDAHKKDVGFKTGMVHNFALVYKDVAGRIMSVLRNEDTSVEIPFKGTGRMGPFKDTETGVRAGVNWAISHSPPSGAAYYQWYYSPLTTPFVQVDVRGEEKSWAQNLVLLKINDAIDRYRDNGVMIPYYEYNEGDRVRIIARGDTEATLAVETTEYDLEIREWYEDEDKSGILVPGTNFNFFTSDIVFLEIYSPQTADTDVYYEYSPIYTITGGSHDTGNATITNGDVYLRLVAPWFFGESRSYSYYYASSNIGIGKPVFFDPNQRAVELSDVVHGGRYFEDTRINDLFRFDDTNRPANLSKRFGKINGLVLRGDTLRVYQEKKTTSIYIGASIIRRPDGTEELVASDRILGTAVPARNDWGCQHPESIVKVGHNIYFYDGFNHAFLRDSVNGVFPISGKVQMGDYAFDYKMVTYFKEDFDDVRCGYDPYTGLLFVKTDEKVLSFHEDSNRWISFYSFLPDYMFGAEKTFLSWRDGEVWAHNPTEDTESDNYKYYDSPYDTIITFFPSFPNKRIFKAISLHSNKAMDLEIEIPSDESYIRGMESWIDDDWFVLKRGIYYHAFLRNALTNSSSKSVADLYNGEKLRGYYGEIELTGSGVIELFKVDILIQ